MLSDKGQFSPLSLVSVTPDYWCWKLTHNRLTHLFFDIIIVMLSECSTFSISSSAWLVSHAATLFLLCFKHSLLRSSSLWIFSFTSEDNCETLESCKWAEQSWSTLVTNAAMIISPVSLGTFSCNLSSIWALHSYCHFWLIWIQTNIIDSDLCWCGRQCWGVGLWSALTTRTTPVSVVGSSRGPGLVKSDHIW